MLTTAGGAAVAARVDQSAVDAALQQVRAAAERARAARR
jgi:hypothetical protein